MLVSKMRDTHLGPAGAHELQVGGDATKGSARRDADVRRHVWTQVLRPGDHRVHLGHGSHSIISRWMS